MDRNLCASEIERVPAHYSRQFKKSAKIYEHEMKEEDNDKRWEHFREQPTTLPIKYLGLSPSFLLPCRPRTGTRSPRLDGGYRRRMIISFNRNT